MVVRKCRPAATWRPRAKLAAISGAKAGGAAGGGVRCVGGLAGAALEGRRFWRAHMAGVQSLGAAAYVILVTYFVTYLTPWGAILGGGYIQVTRTVTRNLEGGSPPQTRRCKPSSPPATASPPIASATGRRVPRRDAALGAELSRPGEDFVSPADSTRRDSRRNSRRNQYSNR